MMRRIVHRPSRSDRGFTLIEASIATVATLGLLAATFTILNMTFVANGATSEMLETQQTVRVAVNTIARDITMAGTGLPGSITVPNGVGSVALVRPGIMTVLPTPANNLSIITPGEAEGPLITGQTAAQNTDVVTIVTVNQQSPTFTLTGYTDTVTGTDLSFGQNIRAGATQLFVNDVLLFTNANGAVMGCVTAVSTVADIASFDDADMCGINQPDAANGQFISDMLNPDLSLPPTNGVRINVITYYLTAVGSHGHPALMRAVNAQAPQEMIEGVEDLRFTYDLYDFATNTATASVVPGVGFAAANQIRSINITVTGRSPDRLRHNNQFYRFSLSSKVNVRNATFRNRYNGP